MKNGTGRLFDSAALVSVSQTSSRERCTTGFAIGGSGTGPVLCAAFCVCVSAPGASRAMLATLMSIGISACTASALPGSAISAGTAWPCVSFSGFAAPVNCSSDILGSVPVAPDHVIIHRQAGTKRCRISCDPRISGAPRIGTAAEKMV